jgi:hypothetical protein
VEGHPDNGIGQWTTILTGIIGPFRMELDNSDSKYHFLLVVIIDLPAW